MYAPWLKCVTDLIRRVFPRRGAAAVAPFSLEPRDGPVKWFDACCTGPLLLSTELHMAPHQEELNQRCCSPHVKTAARGSLAEFT